MTTTRTTRRWRGVVGVALLAGGIGLVLRRSSLVLLGAAAVVLVAYPRLTRAPSVSLALDRTVTNGTPVDGERVEVTVTLRNTGESTLFDCRVVDGVPSLLSVTGGTPRHAAVLRPGAERTFTYTVEATRGVHRFEPASVVVRDIAGATEVETTVACDTVLECESGTDAPLREQTRHGVGDLVTDTGGSGVEFQRTRSYRRGDPLSRIDWNRVARTGELATTEYREARPASVVLCLDGREGAYRTRADGTPHAVSHGVDAVEQVFDALLATPNRVGLAAVGPELCWLEPGRGPEQAARGRDRLGSHPSLSTRRPDAPTTTAALFEQVTELRNRLDADTQVVLFSPLPDDAVVEACLRLRADGHRVTVVAPDVTSDETLGCRLAGVERDRRVSSLRERGVRVVEWQPDRPLGPTLARAQRRWSA